MRVLAFDTSSPVTAVAVVEDGQVVAEDDSPTEARHGEVLLPRVAALLQRAGLPLGALDLLAVGTGPGSFTGLRVGLAAAKGLSLATELPLRGVESLAVLALGAAEGAGDDRAEEVLVAPVLDAFKGEVFAAVYRVRPAAELHCLCPAFHADPASAGARLADVLGSNAARVCGDGATRYRDVLSAALGAQAAWAGPERDLPRGRHVAALGARAFEHEGASDLVMLEPHYLRGSDARLPDKPLRV